MNKKRLATILALLVAAMSLTWASLWQQEIILINTFVEGKPFNFMGFGDLGLAWYTWRDIMYVWVIIGNCLFALTGYYIGNEGFRKRKRKG